MARIGHGGMGDVYRAYERSLDRTVAIKVLPSEFARQPDFIRRFQAEATAAARLVHPNIVQIYFIGEDGGHHFFAMQYVDGYSLASLLETQKKLPIDTSVSLIEQVLLGLEEAHGRGFVHRDIKPGNILIDLEKQRALLSDFGLVKHTQESKTGMTATGVILGTVDYISPEQARGHNVDGRSDLYSIGILFYHILSGRLPFVADSPTALIFQHVYEHPRPLTEVVPHVPGPLAAIVSTLMQKDPAKRYQSVREVLNDLAAYRQGRPLPIGSVRAQAAAGNAIGAAGQPLTPIDDFAPMSDRLPDLQFSGASKPAWERWLNRLRAKFQLHAPQALLDLQNTQQQVDGSVAIYESRRDDLERLVAEAQAVRDELAATARATGGQSDAALVRQLAEQDEQLDGMKLNLSQVKSKLHQLVSQRDLLNARLKAADARSNGHGRIQSPIFGGRKLALWLAAAVACVIVGLIFAFRPHPDTEPGINPTTTVSHSSPISPPPGQVTKAAGATIPPNRLVIHTLVDGIDEIRIYKDMAVWNHRDDAWPVEATLNGVEWKSINRPLMNSGPTKFLDVDELPSNARIRVLKGPGEVLLQTALKGEWYISIADFELGTHEYELEITWD